jgi:hypothetical protein
MSHMRRKQSFSWVSWKPKSARFVPRKDIDVPI